MRDPLLRDTPGMLLPSTTLRIADGTERRPFDAPPVVPETAYGTLRGRILVIRYWTAAEWERTPEGERPANVVRGDSGGWFAVSSRTTV